MEIQQQQMEIFDFLLLLLEQHLEIQQQQKDQTTPDVATTEGFPSVGNQQHQMEISFRRK